MKRLLNIGFCLLMISLPGFAAEAPDYSSLLGVYKGTVYNGGTFDPIITTFSLMPDGRLRGEYIVDDEIEQITGVLTNPQIISETAISFEWTDKHGEGTEEIVFTEDFERFTGFWTSFDSPTQFPINGTRVNAP